MEVRPGDAPAVDRHGPRLLPLDPGGDAQERRLPASRGPEQADDLAGRERQRDVVEDGDAAVAVADAVSDSRTHPSARALHPAPIRQILRIAKQRTLPSRAGR